VALYTRNVLLSLFGGVLLGLFILNDLQFFATFKATLELFTSLLSEAWILKTLAFAILVGSVMALIEKSGGIEGFVAFTQSKKGLIDSKRSALLVPFFIGIFIFIESSITALISGAVGKPLCDSQKVSRAKLAYVCDSTSAPISSLIVLNGWGALLLGLITTQIEEGMISGESVSILMHSVVYNYYALSAIIITFLTIWFNINLGSMRSAKPKVFETEVLGVNHTSMGYMISPILLMIAFTFFFLFITGSGNMLKGSGSSSIFYTMLTTLAFMFFYYVGTKNMSSKTYAITALSGAKKLFPIAMILLFAFAIGKVTTEMNTGLYLASLASENLHVYFLPGIIFLLSSLISFSTGTSWGTFSIMIPVAVPMAVGMDANIALAIGAVISGGVFGDHCSPISDTTIISSMAAECDVVEHVKTQLPYVLISAIIAFILFFLSSLS
jgi:Na+/H+ antiporter NhaC